MARNEFSLVLVGMEAFVHIVWQGMIELSSGRQRKTGFTSIREGKTGLSSGKQGGFSPYRMARNDIDLGSGRQRKTWLW
jgi:hypothetical protein